MAAALPIAGAFLEYLIRGVGFGVGIEAGPARLAIGLAARRINQAIVAECDLLFGDEFGLAACLGMDLSALKPRRTPMDDGPPHAAARTAFETFPQLRAVAYTLREPRSASVNAWQGVLEARSGRWVSTLRPGVELLDRVGGGDAFASGVIEGLLEGGTPQRAVDLGAAHGALAMTTPGDNANVSAAEVETAVLGALPVTRR